MTATVVKMLFTMLCLVDSKNVYPKKLLMVSIIPHTRGLRKLKNRKNKADVKFKRSKADADYAAIRFSVKIIHCYNLLNIMPKYIKKTQVNLSKDPSKFWSYVASKKKTFVYPKTMSQKIRMRPH